MNGLLASIGRLQGDNVVRALQSMLQQAKIALKPANKSSKSRTSQAASRSAATVDKRALACGIIALLQHSSTAAASAASPADSNGSLETLSSLIDEAMTEGMRQQPWLWERLIRQHLDYLLQSPAAVDILTTSLNQLDAQVISRSWAVLSSQLRHVDPMVLCCAPASGNFQRAALSQVSSCFRFISRDVLPHGTATTTAAVPAAAASSTEVDITLASYLPAALYTLLYLVGVTDQQGAPSTYSDVGCVEGAAAYTSMLLTQLCTPESVYKMLKLDTLQQRNKSTAKNNLKNSKDRKERKKGGRDDATLDKKGGGEEEGKEEEEEPELSFENISNIYSAMYTATVLIEAVLTSPQLANSLSTATNTTPFNEHSNLGGEAPTQTPLTRIAVLLSIRWELAQLLAAAGIAPGCWSTSTSTSLAKSFAKTAPPRWSRQTCAAIVDAAMVPSTGSQGLFQQHPHQQQQNAPALTLPPAMLAHALELIQDALTTDKTNSYTADNIEFLSQLLHRVMQVQEASATGVLNPHAAVHAGPGHHVALAAARKLHSLLLSEDSSSLHTDKNKIVENKNGGIGGNGSKRSGHAVPAASKRRKKSGAAGDEPPGQDAVGELMQLFTAGGSGSEQLQPGSTVPLETTTITATTVPAPPPGEISAKPKRKRITPQAIEPNTAALEHPSKFTLDSLQESDRNKNNNKDEEEGSEEEEEISFEQGAKNGAGGGGGTFGRVVMASALDMDDATREASWQAYIADKEKLVEMLGDSAYQEWYDEAEHPLSARTNTTTNSNTNTIDSFFDAIFGGAGEGRGLQGASQGNGNRNGFGGGSLLPQTILKTSLLYPWQATLAASLQLALLILKELLKLEQKTASGQDAGGDGDRAATSAVRICCQNLIPVEQRKASAAAVLKLVDPTHSRNTWLAASKGAELYPASGALLHLVYQLRVLLLRTSRRTCPVMLAGYLALARFTLDTAAEQEDIENAEGKTKIATSKAPWLPLRYVGYIIKSFCCYPPLLAASFNVISAQTLPKLASAGVYPVTESIAYAAGLLWLIVQTNISRGHKRAVRPEWISTAIPEARAHPLIASPPIVQSAAIAELLQQLAGEEKGNGSSGGRGGGIRIVVDAAMKTLAANDGDDEDGVSENNWISSLMPLIDACAAAAFCLHLEQEEEEEEEEEEADQKTVTRGDTSAQKQTVLLGHSKSTASLANSSSILLTAFADSAEALAAALDSSSTPAAGKSRCSKKNLVEIDQRASLLGIGLEFTEIISLIAPLLQAETPSSTVVAVLERATGVQGSCLELLRTLSEDSEMYLAAVRGLENAPVLALPPAPTDGEEKQGEDGADEEEEEEEGAGAEDYDEEGGNASDRPELSAYERRKRLKDIRNPYLRVIVAESRRAAGDAADGELSDLEDFIVANPERDYGDFIADHFPMAQESEDGEEDDSEGEE